jgi:TonB family protein
MNSNYITVLPAAYQPAIRTNRMRGSLISVGIHLLVIGLLLIIPSMLPEAPKETPFQHAESVHLYLIPKLQRPKPIIPVVARLNPPPIPPLRRQAVIPPVQVPKPAPQPKLSEPTLKPAPEIMASAPAIPAQPASPPPPPPARKPAAAEVFASVQTATPQVKPRETHVGDFGDINGVKPANSQSSSMLAKVGGFETAGGPEVGHRSGSGRAVSYGGAGFDSAGGTGGAGTGGTGGYGKGSGGTVQTGGFGEGYPGGQVQPTAKARPIEEKATPVEILAKPKPDYTAEARALKIEGDVSLEVVFQASGGVRVIRVVHGLGHGLDEVAVRVASEIRFRPGTRAGVPVDSKAIIRVTFELT